MRVNRWPFFLSWVIAIALVFAGSVAAQSAGMGEWTVVDEGDHESPSDWTRSGKLIVQKSNIYGGMDGDIEKPGTFVVTGDANWSDYRFGVDLLSGDNDGIGILFRYQDSDNFYRFSMDRQRSYRRLVKKVNGRVSIIAQDAFVYVQEKLYRLEADLSGSSIKIMIDGRLVFNVTDSSHSSGKIGLYCWGNTGSRFQNVAVRSGNTLLYPADGESTHENAAKAVASAVPAAAAGDDSSLPLLAIISPTDGSPYTTDQAKIEINGIAYDDTGVGDVTWRTASGATGTAEGTENWRIVDLPLMPGENEIVITASDTAGNVETQTLVVTYTGVATGETMQVAPPPAPADPALADIDKSADEAIPMPVAATGLGGYEIGSGDVLDISVWKDDALTKMVRVLPDGYISLPLIGQVLASGKTVTQLQSELSAKITQYVPDPVVTVIVQQANSMVIYINGKVNRPGRFDLVANIDVMQALALAGGLTPFAKRNSIRIFRKSSGETMTYHFRYDDVSEGENLEQNIELTKGDLIFVP